MTSARSPVRPASGPPTVAGTSLPVLHALEIFSREPLAADSKVRLHGPDLDQTDAVGTSSVDVESAPPTPVLGAAQFDFQLEGWSDWDSGGATIRLLLEARPDEVLLYAVWEALGKVDFDLTKPPKALVLPGSEADVAADAAA